MRPPRASIVLPFVFLALAGRASAQEGMIEGVVLDAGRPVGGAAVYLQRVDGPAVGRVQQDTTFLDQVHLRFVPGLLVVRPGTEVTFLNNDPLMHNVFGPGSRGGDRFDLGTYPQGQTRGHVFRREGVHTILCHIHPEMVAYVLVTAADYGTSTSDDGRFMFPAVAPGRYKLTTWHPRRFDRSTTEEVVVPPAGRAEVTVHLPSNPPRGDD